MARWGRGVWRGWGRGIYSFSWELKALVGSKHSAQPTFVMFATALSQTTRFDLHGSPLIVPSKYTAMSLGFTVLDSTNHELKTAFSLQGREGRLMSLHCSTPFRMRDLSVLGFLTAEFRGHVGTPNL